MVHSSPLFDQDFSFLAPLRPPFFFSTGTSVFGQPRMAILALHKTPETIKTSTSNLEKEKDWNEHSWINWLEAEFYLLFYFPLAESLTFFFVFFLFKSSGRLAENEMHSHFSQIP